MTQRQKRDMVSALQLLPALIWAAAIAIPIFYIVIISFRTQPEYSQAPLSLPSGLMIDNYVKAWTEGGLGIAFVNNVIVTVVSVAATVGLASLAGYGIARWRGRAGNAIFVYFVLGLIIPAQLGLPLLFKMWSQIGLVDTLVGVMIIHIGGSLPLAIFLYTGFILTVPQELEESARIDGASELRTFVSIVFPLLRPVTATVVILTSIGVWNDLLVSLFFLQSEENRTLTRATVGFTTMYQSDMPVIFACAVLTVAPVFALFIALQKFFISGLTSGALRG